MSSGIVIRPASIATRSCASAPHDQSWTSRGSVPVRWASSSAVRPLEPASRSRWNSPSSSPTYTYHVR